MASLKADHRRPRTPLEWDALNWHSFRSDRHEALFRKAEHRATRKKLRAAGRRECREAVA